MSTAQKLKHKVVLCTQSQLQNMISSGTVESGVDYRVTDVEAATIDDIVNSTADFSQNDQTATNYVKNRTHYTVDYESPELLTNQYVFDGDKVFELVEGVVYTVDIDGSIVNVTAILDEPGAIKLSTTNGNIWYWSNGHNYSGQIIYNMWAGNPEIHKFIIKDCFVHQLDEKYIPDTIARADQIPHELFNKVILNGDQDDFVEIGSEKTFSFNWDTSKGSISREDLHVYFDDVELVYLSGSGGFDYVRLNLCKIMSESSRLSYCSLTVWNQNSDKYGTIDVILSSNVPSTFSCRIEYDDAYYCKQLESKYVPKQAVLPEIITVTGTDIIANMHPNKIYNLTVSGAISSIYININDTYAIAGYDNEWRGYFDTNANAPDPTFSCAQDINWLGGTPTLIKGHHYEFSITQQENSYYGVMVEFQTLI